MTMVEKVVLSTTPIQDINNRSSQRNPPIAPSGEASFENILQGELGRSPAVRFSSHAQRRIESRNIQFDHDRATRLEQAVERAAGKGSRESLILMDDLALVVSVKNRVVITALDGESRKENVFTNIDSVVLT